MIYYVSNNGNDSNSGSKSEPFKTINRAAQIAVAGDVVRVYGGVYREWVDPQSSGASDDCRIVYEAVEGETPIIKGSEIVKDWERVEGAVWKSVIPNSVFGDFNPFATAVFGDWLRKPTEHAMHLGDVYLNGISMYEAWDRDSLAKAEKRTEGSHFTSTKFSTNETIVDPENTVYQWYAEVGEEVTELFCNFQEYDPNDETVEISVRRCCFFPRRKGMNYITVRGFEMAHAATQWAPPTAEQIGMIGPHWSRGWIIENNRLHDSKCSAVSLGTDIFTGDNNFSRTMIKSGYQSQQEAVFLAVRSGWGRDTVGSHLVRNNVIYNCGQCGIVGHMGCIFSRVEHNHIYNVNRKQEFWGHEVAGIKLHAAIDAVIENNNIHDCNLGIWLDWEAQGTRVTKNLFYGNGRDLFIEVTHGPCIIDNNLFLSRIAFQNAAQGTAYVHNLIGGYVYEYNVLDRSTPYHFPHSTDVAGYAVVYGGDDRVINNIVLGDEAPTEYLKYFGAAFDKYSVPEEYMPALEEMGQMRDHNIYYEVPQPVWVEQNAYSGYATPFRAEVGPIMADGLSASVREEQGEWILEVNLPDSLLSASCRAVDRERLGVPRITREAYESPSGAPADLSTDIIGESRAERILPGPIANLKSGLNRITVWSDNK